jgi:leader peptidase (prepilin peptidase)/N-methyltransferase
MIRILATVFAALLGLAFGSFLNVCLSRWPEGESIVRPRSHCRNCSRTLAWWENIPLLSWLALRGRCRGCGTWIGLRYPLVEAAVGAIWSFEIWQLVSWATDPSISAGFVYSELAATIGRMIFYWLLLALAVFDAEHFWLPNRLTLPGIAIGLGFSIIHLGFVTHLPTDEFEIPLARYGPIGMILLDCGAILAAAGLILLIRWAYWLVRRSEGIGLGDAKLMALLAAWLDWRNTLLAFGLGVVMGAVASLALLAIPSVRRGESTWAMTRLPLGTFLCIGGIISDLWGPQIIASYLRWVGF